MYHVFEMLPNLLTHEATSIMDAVPQVFEVGIKFHGYIMQGSMFLSGLVLHHTAPELDATNDSKKTVSPF